MTKVTILRSNSIGLDSRVQKIAKSLSKKYSLDVLGWNRDGDKTAFLDKNDIRVSVFNFSAPTGKLSIILYYPIFWTWVFLKLICIRPGVVHACDIDTFVPAFIYKFIFRKRLIFDLFDRFAMAYLPLKFRPLNIVVNWAEGFAANNSDGFITVGQRLFETVHTNQINSTIVMNCPIDQIEYKGHSSGGELKLVYTGNVRKNRDLEKLSCILDELDNVKLTIAGKCIDDNLLRELLNNPKIIYQGVLMPEETLKLELNSDVMIGLYDPSNVQNAYAMPNKLFESMMCGIPIITNVAQEIVTKYECGVIVNYHSHASIKKAITDLRDNQTFRTVLGKNGRAAFESFYNWNNMERNLLMLYKKTI